MDKKQKSGLLIFVLILFVGGLFGSVTKITAEKNSERSKVKTGSTYYTDEKVANARDNVEKYGWAANMKETAVTNADKYLEYGAEQLWEMVTPQSLPRSFAVNQDLGSPITGQDIYEYGNYPWEADPLNEPWKMTDPSSGYVFPTNDFASYYESGLDEHGLFDPELADEQYLINELYPEKGEDWGVDDGFGWIDEDGNRWTFIAYYNHWHLWHGGAITSALNSFRDAYLYTGDLKYARAGTILLDRIADVYPDMDVSAYEWDDGFLNSHGGTGKGKVVGSIWETSATWNYIAAYDVFFPGLEESEAVDFLSQQAERYNMDNPKDTAASIRENIEDGILREVFPAVKDADIRGNFGMHQRTLAMAAVVLDEEDTSEEWIDWVFQSGDFEREPDYHLTGGDILGTLVNEVDRDGFGNEAAPGYNNLWLDQLKSVGDILDGYDRYPEADLYNNVKFKKMFDSRYPIWAIGNYTPTIGDSGKAGAPGLVGTVEEHVLAFEKYGDPIYAQVAYYLNGSSAEGLHGDIFSSDPNQMADMIQTIIDTEGTLNLSSTNLAGYGFTSLRDGQSDDRKIGLTYDFPSLDIISASVGHNIFTNSGTLQLEADNTGENITFSFDVPKTDMYKVDLAPFKASSYGIYSIKLDGKKVAEQDFYGNSGASSEMETLTTVELTEGTHEITFENEGKNEKSSNYKMGVMQLILLDEAAQIEQVEQQMGDTQRDLWMYYGRNTGHGHKDTLNIGLHAFGVDLSPDLGYPEFTGDHPKRHQWTSNTISHNTVVVDESKQGNQWVGTPRHYDGEGKVQLIDVEAPDVYSQTEQYRRTTSYIKVDEANSYAVDFFRVKGGNDHHFSFHGAEGNVSTEGLELVEQPTGTYAGPDVEFGEKEADQPSGGGYMGSGFHYLKNVERDDNPTGVFSVDWDMEDTWDVLGEADNPHLRLTMVNGVDDVALADGEPPRNKPGNPENLRYLVAHRSGEDLSSQFVSVIEPYNGDRYIESIQSVELKVEGEVVETQEAAAVKVELKNGRIDYIVNSLDPDILYTVDDAFTFKGFFGVHSVEDEESIYSYLHDGTVLGDRIETEVNTLNGTVADFTKDLEINNQITVNMDQSYKSLEDLIGSTIYVENDGIRNGAYLIEGIEEQEDNRVTINIGNITLVRNYVDSDDLSKGFTYNIEEGAIFTIPLSTEKMGVHALQQLVEQLKLEGELENERVHHTLKLHLTAVGHFDKKGKAGKVVKHMNSFNQLLEHQLENELISAQAYAVLKAETDLLIQQWQ